MRLISWGKAGEAEVAEEERDDDQTESPCGFLKRGGSTWIVGCNEATVSVPGHPIYFLLVLFIYFFASACHCGQCVPHKLICMP